MSEKTRDERSRERITDEAPAEIRAEPSGGTVRAPGKERR